MCFHMDRFMAFPWKLRRDFAEVPRTRLVDRSLFPETMHEQVARQKQGMGPFPGGSSTFRGGTERPLLTPKSHSHEVLGPLGYF